MFRCHEGARPRRARVLVRRARVLGVRRARVLGVRRARVLVRRARVLVRRARVLVRRACVLVRRACVLVRRARVLVEKYGGEGYMGTRTSTTGRDLSCHHFQAAVAQPAPVRARRRADRAFEGFAEGGF